MKLGSGFQRKGQKQKVVCFFYRVDRGKINTVWVLWLGNGLVSPNQMLDNCMLLAKFAGQLLAKQEAKPQTLEVLC